MAKAASNSGGRDSGRKPRSPLPPPTNQRTSLRKMVRESWGELRKVQWPTRQQVVQGTIVVGVVTVVFAVYLTAIDYVMVRVVRELDQFLTG